jgi:hypothetical protein
MSTGSKIVNPNSVFTLDIESTHLYFNEFFSAKYKDGKFQLPDISLAAEAYKPAVPLQFGIQREGGKIQHINLTDAHTVFMPKEITTTTTLSDFVSHDGKRRIKGVLGKTQYHSEKQLADYLGSAGSKMSERQVSWYMDKVAWQYLAKDKATTVTIDNNGKKLNLSKFSFDKFILNNDPASMEKAVLSKGVQFQSMNFNKFIASGEADSLADLVNDVIKKGSIANPSEVRAWNAPFDINYIRSILYNNGNQKLQVAFDDAVRSGKVAINSVERDWQLIAYNLIKDDPEAAGKVIIGYSPAAARETGRIGQVVKTFEEFQHSTVSWSQENVSKYMKWYSKIQELGEQTHFAGPDVKLTNVLSDAFQLIKTAAMDDALAKGTKYGSFEELALSDKGSGHIVNAIDAVIKKESAKQLGTTAKSLRSDIMKDAIKTGEWYKKNFAGYYASKLAKDNKTKWAAKYGKKYAAPAAAIGGILALTYLNAGRESDIEEFTHGINRRSKTDGKESWGAHRYIDREAHYKSHIFKTMAMGVAAPFGVLYATGLHMANKDPKWFGGKKPPVGLLEQAKEIVRTAGYGARRIESAMPITRLFGISSVSDYLLGSRRASDKSGKFGKADSFKMVDKGKAQEFGMEFDQFLEEAKRVNPDKYAELSEVLKPQKLSKGLDRRIVRIQSLKGGGTKVYWDDEYRAAKDASTVGQKVSRNMTIDLNVRTMNLRTLDPKFASREARQAYAVEKGINVFAKGHILNPIAYEFGQEYASLHGAGKISKAEYLKNTRMPQGIMGNSFLGKVWTGLETARYHLDIGSKGVGEGRDLFSPSSTQLLSKTKRIIQVRGQSLDKASAQSMKLMYGAYKHVIRQTLVPIYGMNNFLESPFETMGLSGWAEETLGLKAAQFQESTSITKNIAGKALSFIQRPGLGLRINDMKHGLPQYAAEFGLKRILPAYAAIQAFSLLDKGLGALTMSPTGHGPLTVLPIKAWETMALGYSKVSDLLGLTTVAKKQESVAPGSTGIGFFAPAMSAYSIYRAGKFLGEKGPEPVRRGITNLLEMARKAPVLGEALRAEKYLGATARTPISKYMAWAVKNPLLGLLSASLIPMAPFIPGFLGSNKTYQERKAEYAGEKEVAVRKYRGWLLSSSAYTGGKAIQFRRHALNLLENNWADQGVIYPSAGAHLANGLTMGLSNRYMLEEYHAKDQPVYTSSPYGSNVPLLGGIIASTIGKIIKPEVRYHEMNEQSISGIGAIEGSGSGERGSLGGDLAVGSIVESGEVNIESPHSTKANMIGLQRSFSEWSGLKGFIGETTMQYLTGKQSADEFTPYAQDSQQMNNPANIMWGYQAGDVSIIGGEFLRRIFQRPAKTWTVNDIPNELYGVSWIPQQYDTKVKHRKDFTHGTTFDKMPLGWLYASRKGWDWLYGSETKGKELEQYAAPIRTEILQQIAPHSREFSEAAQSTLKLALNNQLDPEKEQRYYETLDQVRQLKEQIWATAGEYTDAVETTDISATVSEVDPDTGTFRIRGSEDRVYRIAGISTAIEDIRSRLLSKKAYNSAQQLDADAQRIRATVMETIRKNVVQGQRIDMAVAQADNLQSNKGGIEAIIGGLNKELIDQGAPFADTGTIATHNIAQMQVGPAGTMAAKYWQMLTSADTLANKKLISKRDYFSQYQTTQYFNKEVKLWSHPFKHLVEPFIASVAHNVGIDIMPSFTSERRENQQYWDVIKYVKYKMLAVQASHDGDQEAAAMFQQKYQATMVGADPTNDTLKDELNALPLNERAFFDFFANEPDPKKRAKIYKYLPAPAKRLYTGIWAKKMAEGGDKGMRELFSQLKETGGYRLSAEEEKMYRDEGGGDKAAWARAHFVREYAEEHALPGTDWSGWSPDVDIDDVEILSLRDQGEQVQDYGFFDDKVRMAAFNGTAFAASVDLHTRHASMGNMTGTMMPILAMNDNVQIASSMPTSSQFPMNTTNIQTDSFQKTIMRGSSSYAHIIDDVFMAVTRGL